MLSSSILGRRLNYKASSDSQILHDKAASHYMFIKHQIFSLTIQLVCTCMLTALHVVSPNVSMCLMSPKMGIVDLIEGQLLHSSDKRV